jgi:NNP family nitrate/nitrite transporter-like MFS transporter
VGSLARPFGGRLADRLGGARVTFWNFGAMALLTFAALHCLAVRSFAGFLLVFLGLFVTTGIGNGSTFRMIPIIFRSHWLRGVDPRDAAATERALACARREGAAVLGFTSAVGALGGFFIPRAFGASIAATGGVGYALGAFLGCYLGCIALTWWCYLRTSFLVARAPSLAQANA